MPEESNIIGRNAEDQAQRYFKKLGYELLERNYRCHFGEIDIIAKDRKCFVFVEVKCRKNNSYGAPEEFVLRKKQGKITRSAIHYIKSRQIKDPEIRFDVFSVSGEDLAQEHFKGAFEVPSKYHL